MGNSTHTLLGLRSVPAETSTPTVSATIHTLSVLELPFCFCFPQPFLPAMVVVLTSSKMRALFGIAALMVSIPPSRGFHYPEVVSKVRGNTRRITSSARNVASSYYTAWPSPTALDMATWSNGQAIREYQDFLATGRCDAMHLFIMFTPSNRR